MEIKMSGIHKSFGAVRVLKNAGVHIKPREVHALMGENGAGKSTLMKILTGVYTKDEGTIEINGEIQHFNSIKDSEDKGIAFIHQELNVLNDMSIVDNMFLGKELTNKFGLLDKKKMYQKSKEKLMQLGLDVDPNALISSISIGKRQLVEIAKALLMDAELIIMDEPTAALTDKEVRILFNIINGLKEKGVSFVYISHKMEEIFEICDEITVMRDGEFIGQKTIAHTNFDEIVSMMVGYALEDRFPYTPAKLGKKILSVHDLTLKHKFENVSFDLYEGEVLGFAGLMGAGRTDVMHAIFGSVKFESGYIEINGNKVKVKSPIQGKDLGIGFITEDRKNEGLVLPFSVKENMMLPSLEKHKKTGLLDESKMNSLADDYIKHLNIKTDDRNKPVGKLSGGNQQKVVLAKWLINNPRILILDEPTRGVDVGAKKEIYQIINDLKQQGVAVIVVSSELPEVMGICDRIAIMHEKKLKKIFLKDEVTQEKIMTVATGGMV